MSSPTLDAVVGGLGGKGVEALKVALGDAWDHLTDDEKEEATELMLELAKVHIWQIAGWDVSSYLPALQATFEQWAVVGKQVVIDGVHKAALEVFGIGGAFVGSAVGALVKSFLK